MKSFMALVCLLVVMVRCDIEEIDPYQPSNLCDSAEGCWCYNSGEGVRADCTGEHITHVPEDLPLNTTELKISQSKLHVLVTGNLSIYSELTSLELMYNEMTTIEVGAFEGLDQLEMINLHSNNLTQLPQNLFHDTPLLERLYLYLNYLQSVPDVKGLSSLTNLDLQLNKIQRILADDFQGLSNLMTLSLFENSISDIASNSFGDLSKVTLLTLQLNAISGIQSGDFDGLSSLNDLNLESNEIGDLPADVFDSLTVLNHVDISRNNIGSIHTNAFNNMNMLAYLDLDYNQLTTVPSDALLKVSTSLDYLDLSGNLLETLPAEEFISLGQMKELFLRDMPSLLTVELDAFKGMPTLTQIALSHNPNLTQFTPEHLPDDQVPELTHLYISDNGFVHLSEELFATKASLLRADVHGNPFHCDCQLKWMPRVIEDGAVWAIHWTQAGSAPRCNHPPHLETMPISSMVEADLTCDEVEVELVTEQRIVAYLRGNSTFKANLYNGLPATMWKTPKGEWLIPNTLPPPEDKRYDVQAFVDDEHTVMAYLNIDNSSSTDEGEYLLVATNIEGNVTITFELEVLPYELTDPVTTPGVGGVSHLGSQWGSLSIAFLLWVFW